MADPRILPGFEGLGAEYLTAVYDNSAITYDATAAGGSAEVGLAVSFTATGKVISTVAADEGVLGQLVKVESDGRCVVQYKGYMKLPTGTTPGLTWMGSIIGLLLVAAEGYVGAVDAAGEVYVQRGNIIDTTLTTVEIDGTDVDAVEVIL